MSGWCERGDSNPYGISHWILSPARLPVPPLSRLRRILVSGLKIDHPLFAVNFFLGVGPRYVADL
ncbi:hypothetical protein TRIP_B350425 [uncultured Desulfatiglans sp.]|nr:hypothetical protein TRIP_B350425 [uncultured Desulfatiglans sp.]